MAEQPPPSTDRDLSAYLERLFDRVENKFLDAGKLPVRKLLAPKPVVGKLYYYGQPILDENGDSTVIDAAGLYIYKAVTDDSGEYVFIA
jgi:hypothetical protein